MAKQTALSKAPELVLAIEVLKNYLPITDENKTEILVKGRPVYVFQKGVTKYIYLGCFDIRPRMQKGMLTITEHPLFGNSTTKISENENKEEYLKSIQSVVKNLIEKGMLYYKENDKLVQYQINN